MEKSPRQEMLDKLKLEFPFGYKRFEAIASFAFYVHTEALKQISGLCRRSGLPSLLWGRIENTFLNQYGLSKWKDKLYVQEELIPLEGEQGYVKNGLSEDLEDYLNILGEDLIPTEEGMRKFMDKREKQAKELQEKANLSKERVEELKSDKYDAAGRLRTPEHVTKEEYERNKKSGAGNQDSKSEGLALHGRPDGERKDGDKGGDSEAPTGKGEEKDGGAESGAGKGEADSGGDEGKEPGSGAGEGAGKEGEHIKGAGIGSAI